MKQISVLILLSTLLFGCASSPSQPTSSASTETSESTSESNIKTAALEMHAYLTVGETVAVYWDTYALPDEVKDDIPEVVLPGDALTVTHTGDFHGQAMIGGEAYPSDGSRFNFLSYAKCEIVEITFAEGMPVAPQGKNLTFDAMNLSVAIASDMRTVPFASLAKGYACVSAKESGVVRAIYVESPR